MLAKELQAALKLATVITTLRTYGTNEDIGVALLCSAFDGDALNLARTALSDTPQFYGATFRLHGVLSVAAGISPATRSQIVAGCV